MKLSGTWIGEYTYGPGYGERAGTSVPFTLSLTATRLGIVAGYVRDDASRGGMPERGRVLGKLRENAIAFVKTMPRRYTMDGLHAHAELRQTSQHDAVQPSPRPHRVDYRGRLHADGTLSGEWRILAAGGGQGTWSARRVSLHASAV